MHKNKRVDAYAIAWDRFVCACGCLVVPLRQTGLIPRFMFNRIAYWGLIGTNFTSMKYLLTVIISLIISTHNLHSQIYTVEAMSTERSDGTWNKFASPRYSTTLIFEKGILTIYDRANGALDIVSKELVSKNDSEIVWKGIALRNLKVTVSTRQVENNQILWLINLEGSRSAYLTRQIKD